MSRPLRLLAALAFAATLPMLPAAAADYAPVEPIASDEAAAQLGRRARLLVAVGPDGELRAAARGDVSGPAEPPIKAEDPSVRAVLSMLGLDGARRFAIVGVRNPQCVKICELVGGDYICRKVCS
jgi:hypothetical protein